MTSAEAYELITRGGTSDFGRLIAACQEAGPYCLIGGLAVNCYVDPVYTLDADLVAIAEDLPRLTAALEAAGFHVEAHEHSVNVQAAASDLRIQFTTDPRYQEFPARSVDGDVLGVRVRVACLEDLTRGKLWAFGDPSRRLSKRKKDELDLIRLAESYPHLRALYPESLTKQLG